MCMSTLPEKTMHTIQYLKNKGIDPILYGSQGVSIYLGAFKEFGDIDLLVPDEYLNSKWQFLQDIMEEDRYSLVDSHEHEFKNDDNQIVAFASMNILLRDGVLSSLDDVIELDVVNTKVKTLRAKDFIKAYEFSKKDGYRKNNRGKNDQDIIDLLKNYENNRIIH